MTSGIGATARLWIARIALLWGAIGFAHAMARQADKPRGLVLWLLAAPLIALAIAAAGLVVSPLPARWVAGAAVRWRARLVALWLPCGIVYYVAGFLLSPDPDYWNWIFGRLFWPLTIAVMMLATDALAASARSGELWLLVGSIMVALIAGEMAARSWVRYGVKSDWERAQLDPGTTSFLAPRYAPHHYESYIPKPGFVSRDGRNRHNALGFRGGEITQPKPAGVFRIAALGGSTTYDTEVRDWHDAYPAQLEKLLNAGRPDGGVEVVNAGVPGHDTGEILINLEFRVLDLHPDLLILYENTNDVASRIVPPQLYRGDNSGRRKIWDSEAVARATSPLMRVPSALLRFLAVKLRWFGDGNVVSLDDVVEVPCSGHLVHVSCLGMSVGQALEANPPIYFERHVRGIAAIARGAGVPVLLMTWAHNPNMGDYAGLPEIEKAFAEHNEIITRVAQEEGTLFLDFAPLMPRDKQLWADGRHMTAEGNSVRARIIADYLAGKGIIRTGGAAKTGPPPAPRPSAS